MVLRKLPLLLLLLAAAAALPTVAPAAAKIRIGISDNDSNMFANRWFKPLKVRYARIVVPYDIATRKDFWPQRMDAYVAGAKANRVEVHVAFNIRCLDQRCWNKGPTAAGYLKLFKAFRKRWPSVRVFTPWNEENHSFQPTSRRPKLAYDYYRMARRGCPTCTVLAADVLDDANLTSWLRRFKRYYKGRGTWGIHNYQDANKHRPFRSSWTYKMARVVKGDIWSTEAGGLVGFKTVKGRVAYRYSLSRQRSAQRYLFQLMGNRKVRNRYKRVYIYRFFGTWSKTRRTDRWDSGLIGLDGKRRPAWYDLRRLIARNR